MGMDSRAEQDLRILEEIELDPDITQIDLATRLGVAVGSVNWYLKRLINKGYVKVRKMQRRRLRYLITPQGIAAKSELTAAFMRASMKLYRETRAAAQKAIAQARRAGFDEVSLDGDSDLTEVCYLTCLEQGIRIAESPTIDTPLIKIDGRQVVLVWPDGRVDAPSAPPGKERSA
jgi:DNA-binding MarR family transcriptional regulator